MISNITKNDLDQNLKIKCLLEQIAPQGCRNLPGISRALSPLIMFTIKV